MTGYDKSRVAVGDAASIPQMSQTKVDFSNDRPSGSVKDGPVELLPFLYLGSAFHSSRRDTLTAAGITAVLNVSSTCPNFYEGDFEYLRLTVEDSLAADIRACFSTAIAFIGELLLSPTVQAWRELGWAPLVIKGELSLNSFTP